jgi:hypothetical protein
LPVLLPRTLKAYMVAFLKPWQHPAIYNLIDHSSNLLGTCSRVRPIFITRSALLHLVGDSAQRFSRAPHIVGGSPVTAHFKSLRASHFQNLIAQNQI